MSSEYELLKKEYDTILQDLNDLKIKYNAIQATNIPGNKRLSEATCPLIRCLHDIACETHNEQKKYNAWDNSRFSMIDELKLDYVGKLGERLLDKICNILDIPCHFNFDINSKDGTYDGIIFDRKIEGKTARCGKNGTFQHENLRNGGCDFYAFVDIMPNYFFLTILKTFDLSQRCEVMGRKPHLRKGTSDVFKFDFSLKNIENAIKQGKAIKIDDTTDIITVKQFMMNALRQ
jgi:hypothetical protein